jgi:hypothetical protein
VKASFYEELEYMFDKFPKYHMAILLGGFNWQLGMGVYTKLVMTMELD